MCLWAERDVMCSNIEMSFAVRFMLIPGQGPSVVLWLHLPAVLERDVAHGAMGRLIGPLWWTH